ncbi:MAG: FHA domain-containing protein [Steroidobacteraceae bacterium]
MTSRQPHLAVPGAADLEDTAELPALQLPDGKRPEGLDDELPGAAAPAQFTRLEGDLRGLTSSLRGLEAELGHKSEQIQAYERDVGARDAQIGRLQSELDAAAVRYHELEAQEAARSVALDQVKGERDQLQADIAQLRREIGGHGEQRSVMGQAQERLQQRLDGLEIELAETRQRAGRYHETLQDHEGRRGFFDSLLRERDRAVSDQQARTQALEQMHLDLKRAADVREQEISAQLHQQRDIVASLGTQLESANSQLAAVRRELDETRASVDRHNSELSAERARTHTLSERCDELQQRLDQTLCGGQQSEQRVRAQEREIADHQEVLRSLNGQLAELRGAEENARADLRAAEDGLRTLESDLRHRDTQLVRAEQNDRDLRAQLAAATQQLEERNRLIARLESEAAASAAVLGHIRTDLDRMGRAEAPQAFAPAGSASLRNPAPGAGAQYVHLLVRTEGDSGIVHVLGKRTTVGRKEDNDLRIEADFISRHHALVVVNDHEAIVEDLHSANGVYVNGVRISRKPLVEGDLVTIGRTEFRYVRKPASERSPQ